jgi:S-formylglutathione hydrolase
MELVSQNLIFGGEQRRYAHRAKTLNCDMHFSIYLPPQAKTGEVPLLYWLSGLTCNDENFVTKAGAQQYAAKHGMALVMPDTSPRGEGMPDDPEGAWDFGLGAGFYVNATEQPFAAHYQMYTYVTEELPALLKKNIPGLSDRCSIAGHSMGGHGALTIALRNPDQFKSVSAFAPICSPMTCPWGEKALAGYLGADRSTWEGHDACLLISKATKQLPMLIDQGEADNFVEQQLQPQKLIMAAKEAGYPLKYRSRPGYDHSYFTIATFIEEHINFHAEYLAS